MGVASPPAGDLVPQFATYLSAKILVTPHLPCQRVLFAPICLLFLLGKILDYLTFVPIFTNMNMEDMNYSADASAQNNGDNGPEALDDMNTDENIAGTAHLNDDMTGSGEEVERLTEELQ